MIEGSFARSEVTEMRCRDIGCPTTVGCVEFLSLAAGYVACSLFRGRRYIALFSNSRALRLLWLWPYHDGRWAWGRDICLGGLALLEYFSPNLYSKDWQTEERGKD